VVYEDDEEIAIEEITDNTDQPEETEVTLPGLKTTYTVLPDTTQIVPTAKGIPSRYTTITDNVARAPTHTNAPRPATYMNNMQVYPQAGIPFGMHVPPHNQSFMYQTHSYAGYPEGYLPQGWLPPPPQDSPEYKYWYNLFTAPGTIHNPPAVQVPRTALFAPMQPRLNEATFFGTDEEEKEDAKIETRRSTDDQEDQESKATAKSAKSNKSKNK
jgi:hypothetical protein